MNTGKVNVEIQTGNDAVQTPEDIADLLRGVAKRIESGDMAGNVRDDNGNTVGFFSTVIDQAVKGDPIKRKK